MMHGERLACASKTESGQTDAEIAKTLGWSKWTVWKWRRAYQKKGEDGLLSRMGRPRGGPLSTFPLEVRDELGKMRKTHPGWGSVTLVEESFPWIALARSGTSSSLLESQRFGSSLSTTRRVAACQRAKSQASS